MTLAEAQELVSRLTYKPGATFELRVPIPSEDKDWDDWQQGLLQMIVTLRVIDVKPPHEEIEVIQVKKLTEEFLQDARGPALINFIVSQVFDMEKHEMREWLKVDGKQYLDPHPEGAGK